MTALLATLALALPAADYGAGSTAYCLRGRMADGTHVRWGSVASNRHRLGTRIRLTGRSFYGMRSFVVRDRIGHGSQLDFWTPSCGQALRWGRRYVTYRVTR